MPFEHPQRPLAGTVFPPPRPPSPSDFRAHTVVFGDLQLAPAYPSFYPQEDMSTNPVDKLFVCPTCFKYTEKPVEYVAHKAVCRHRDELPGQLVYDGHPCNIYEVDGEDYPLLGQNLSLFSKLFIESKSVCFDVHGFTYYLLADSSPSIPSDMANPTMTVVGFFSKEKLSWDSNNLACIVVFPPWQRSGYGQMLMASSYMIGKREGRLGGPERPLSKPGKRSYERYWARAVAQYVLGRRNKDRVTVNMLSQETFILQEDILNVLSQMGALGAKRGSNFLLRKRAIREWLVKANLDVKPPIDPDKFCLPPSSCASEVEFEDDQDEEEQSENSS